MKYIVNYYIEVSDEQLVKLESYMYQNKLAFYDASHSDPYTKPGSNWPTIESIEADIEAK